jgi:5,10-methylene-tetrahydrofolate dehydrogenase/methenyl tetrahydrofolate cyclohydrolase
MANEATVISGKLLAAAISNSLRARVRLLPAQPHIALVQIGDRSDSSQYVKMKTKAAEDVLQYNKRLELKYPMYASLNRFLNLSCSESYES